jgi:transposase-like protein
MTQFNNLLEMVDYFKSEKDYIKFLQNARWGNRVVCPHCNHDTIYTFSDSIRFKCASCKSLFTVKTNSIFADSKISFRKWFIAYYYIVNHKKGISSHQLGRDIKVTQKTAWFMLQRIRSGMTNGIFNSPIGEYDVVEIDETFVGGKNKNRHWDKKVKNSQGRSFKDKTPVLGMLERGGKVKVAAISDTKRKSIQPLVKKNVIMGSTVVTDEWWAYRTLYTTYEHSFVNHGARQYVDGTTHTNTIEGFWSLFKRAIYGIYHSISAKYLQFYVAESAFRYNTRKMSQSTRMFLLFHNANGKLSRKDLMAYAA